MQVATRIGRATRQLYMFATRPAPPSTWKLIPYPVLGYEILASGFDIQNPSLTVTWSIGKGSLFPDLQALLGTIRASGGLLDTDGSPTSLWLRPLPFQVSAARAFASAGSISPF